MGLLLDFRCQHTPTFIAVELELKHLTFPNLFQTQQDHASDPGSDNDDADGGSNPDDSDDLVMLSDGEVMDNEVHPFQVVLDEEAQEASAAAVQPDLSLDVAEDSQLELPSSGDGQASVAIVPVLVEDTPPRNKAQKGCASDVDVEMHCGGAKDKTPPRAKKHEFGSSSPHRKFQELTARLNFLKKKQAERSFGSTSSVSMSLAGY